MVMFHSYVYQMVKKSSFSVSTSWFQELPGEVQSKTKATDPSAKSRSLCRVSTQHGKAWWLAGSKMLMEHLWNIYGTSMARWNIYGLGLENWMKTGDDFHGVGIGLMPWDASNHPMFENWILGHQIIPNLELES
jgi:hypothetical protein